MAVEPPIPSTTPDETPPPPGPGEPAQPGQPSHDSIKAAAEAAGLAFRYIPVISGQMTMDNVQDQAKALDGLEGPVFAYCRSGTRCANLFAAVQQMKN